MSPETNRDLLRRIADYESHDASRFAILLTASGAKRAKLQGKMGGTRAKINRAASGNLTVEIWKILKRNLSAL